MVHYFKSYYNPCKYSPNWYGALDYAPPATVLLYNDNDNFCIGYMDIDCMELVNHPTLQFYNSDEEALQDIANSSIDDANIWFGERLEIRWTLPEEDGLG